jgi:serine/threonine protein kinase/Cdc6-like AAA superfamily ATPase
MSGTTGPAFPYTDGIARRSLHLTDKYLLAGAWMDWPFLPRLAAFAGAGLFAGSFSGAVLLGLPAWFWILLPAGAAVSILGLAVVKERESPQQPSLAGLLLRGAALLGNGLRLAVPAALLSALLAASMRLSYGAASSLPLTASVGYGLLITLSTLAWLPLAYFFKQILGQARPAAPDSDPSAAEAAEAENEPPAPVNFCQFCGSRLAPLALTCDSCGKELDPITQSEFSSPLFSAGQNRFPCAQCGHSNPLGNAFCENCGASITLISELRPPEGFAFPTAEEGAASPVPKRLSGAVLAVSLMGLLPLIESLLSLPFLLAGLLLGVGAHLLGASVQPLPGLVRAKLPPPPPPAPEPPLSNLLISQHSYGESQVPLKPIFRFLHEPIAFHEHGENQAASVTRFVGRDTDLREFIQRILLSEGGAFLVTGYRGVGKTSFVNRVIDEIRSNLPALQPRLGPLELLDIRLNIARSLTPLELMHHILRSLYNRLEEQGQLRYFDPHIQKSLLLSYQRTSFNLSRKTSRTSESNMSLGDLVIGLPSLGLAPKLGGSLKRTRVENLDMNYLAYDDKAAEYDLIHLSRQLIHGYRQPQPPLRRLVQRLRRQAPRRVRLKILFVFDELDKLEGPTADSEETVIDNILAALKTLLTTSGITFIFVAGKDLHERWLADIGRGDSVYESVFGYDKYLPALWNGAGQICDSLVDGSIYNPAYQTFRSYLEYAGRGMPRRILRNFNQYVHWDGQRPYLYFRPAEIRRFQFFAGLQKVIDQDKARLLGELREGTPGERRDKRYLGIYYLLDWILQQGSRPFSFQEAAAAARQLSAKISPADESIRNLLEILVSNEYLEPVSIDPGKEVVADPSIAQDPRYRLPRRRVLEMGPAEENVEEYAPSFRNTSGLQGSVLGKYRLQERLARGGMSEVYQAIDPSFGRLVAVKISTFYEPELVGRFQQEAQLFRRLDHPNIVPVFDFGEDQRMAFMVMKFIDGLNLNQVLANEKKLDLDTVLSILHPVGQALAYLHRQDIVRCDIKPSNIMLSRSGEVILIDLGTAKQVRPDETSHTQVIGTPLFMPPEQFTGENVDGRVDIYALGVNLYQLLTGAFPFEGTQVHKLMQAHMAGNPIPIRQRDPGISAQIEAVIDRCLQKDPAGRYQRVEDWLEALPSYNPVDLRDLVGRNLRMSESLNRREDSYTQEGSWPLDVPVPAAAPQVPGTGAYRERPAPRETPLAPPPPSIPSDEGTFITQIFVQQVSSERAASTEEVQGKPHLVIDNGPLAGQRYIISERLTIGRSLDNHLVLDDSQASRYHAELDIINGAVVLKDLNSVNGTFVNGERQLEAPLSHGDRIQIGSVEMYFQAA